MICATALGDLTETTVGIGKDLFLRMLSSALLFGAALSAILYGSFTYDQISGQSSAAFQSAVLTLSFWMSGVFLVLGTLVQIFIARLEEPK